MKNYLSLIKFSHTIFALPFALIGFFLAVDKQAEGIDWKLFVLVILCMVFARSAAMAFNRYIDRDIDKKNPRTAIREIPAGLISPQNALFFILVNCILFVLCTYFINTLCLALSPVALAVVLGYSYTKRFTALCHFVLGVGLALAPIGAYIAVTGVFELLPVLYSFVVLFWVAGFDIIYALQDEEFDRNLGLNSIPAAMGKAQALRLSNVLHIITAALVIYAGIEGDFEWLYIIGASIFILLLTYQHFLVKPHDLSRVNLAFFTTNGIASAIFGAFVIGDLFLLG
ncbi:MAG: putative 4-hydroxybenzoate polyprenyltransferase [Saprospiraceae bacterium]|nr:putative 4-hydroxybenzoate polyprenyltransferase [Saprospiraceae bacterium]